jgi:hypothetical protein
MKLETELSSEIIHTLQIKTKNAVLEIIIDLYCVTEFVTLCETCLIFGRHHLQQLL